MMTLFEHKDNKTDNKPSSEFNHKKNDQTVLAKKYLITGSVNIDGSKRVKSFVEIFIPEYGIYFNEAGLIGQSKDRRNIKIIGFFVAYADDPDTSKKDKRPRVDLNQTENIELDQQLIPLLLQAIEAFEQRDAKVKQLKQSTEFRTVTAPFNPEQLSRCYNNQSQMDGACKKQPANFMSSVSQYVTNHFTRKHDQSLQTNEAPQEHLANQAVPAFKCSKIIWGGRSGYDYTQIYMPNEKLLLDNNGLVMRGDALNNKFEPQQENGWKETDEIHPTLPIELSHALVTDIRQVIALHEKAAMLEQEVNDHPMIKEALTPSHDLAQQACVHAPFMVQQPY